ncbi:MAG: right-handed parallel beta-helix repeat-containing protein [Armatimonadetes bacterium]|nr:right-handed parallel beta-helix repeat-containing protein [Armatimonadota bacterium]
MHYILVCGVSQVEMRLTNCKHLTKVVLLTVFLFPSFVPVAVADAAATQRQHVYFYVSTDGSDRNLGTKNRPFATLQKARDAVRGYEGNRGIDRPITVLVRGGKYFMHQTLVLGEQDSGTSEFPVTYAAYPGEKPILSGGQMAINWKPYKGQILQGELPGGKDGKIKARQMTFNGKLQRRARWPNYDPKNPLSGGWATIEGPDELGNRDHIAFRYKGRFTHHWSKPQEGEVNVMPFVGWCNNIVPIASTRRAPGEDNRVVTLIHEVFRGGADNFERYQRMPLRPGNRFFVENLLEELDQPGEWCLDSEEGTVYFWPKEKLTFNSEAVIPWLDCLIDLNGASHIKISGLTFTETTSGDNYHRAGLEGYGAMFPIPGWKYCGETTHLKDARFCEIENCHFYAVGGNGIYLEGYNLENKICGNKFSYVGANGVCLFGTKERHPVSNQITDNDFYHTGVLLYYTAAVSAGLSDRNLIAHNDIHDLPHHAINLGANSFGRNIVEYNDIRRVCLVLNDSAAINAWMDEFEISPTDGKARVIEDVPRVGHIMRFNYIANAGSWGFYLDDYASNCVVQGNIIVRPRIGGIVVHGGSKNILEDNVMIDCFEGIHLSNGLVGRPEGIHNLYKGNRISRNITYMTRRANTDPDEANLYGFWNYTTECMDECDRNIFFNTAGRYIIHNQDGRVTPPGSIFASLEDWRRHGHDIHSIVADPLFVDPKGDDYRLRPESPAFQLGFQPIDISQIGIRPREDRTVTPPAASLFPWYHPGQSYRPAPSSAPLSARSNCRPCPWQQIKCRSSGRRGSGKVCATLAPR